MKSRERVSIAFMLMSMMVIDMINDSNTRGWIGTAVFVLFFVIFIFGFLGILSDAEGE